MDSIQKFSTLTQFCEVCWLGRKATFWTIEAITEAERRRSQFEFKKFQLNFPTKRSN